MKIGIDIGGSHIGIGVVNEEGKIVEKREKDLTAQFGDNIRKELEEYICVNVKELINEYEIDRIGIASPGVARDGKVSSLVNLGINEIDIGKIIKSFCNLPYRVNNDAKCAAIAEKRYGSLKGFSDAVFLCIGTGIGGAVFMDDNLLTPKKNSGFEIGHMIIQKDGNLCNCGKRGCFETYCSMKRLKNRLIEILNLPNSTSSIKLLEILQENKEKVILKEEIDTYLNDLIVGLSNMIDIFEPEAICIGGGFVYFEDILYERLIEKYYKEICNRVELPELKLAKLRNDAGIIGA